ncbi:hypothetical protein RhiJN_17418 [Ceratobasidium sp. AG-Ba]|nr:hypothetical protein RhiJN_17418 [Ceratobasidium sp. AG-Ba]
MVAEFLFELRSPEYTDTIGEQQLVCSIKPNWKEVVGFLSASQSLRQMAIPRWFQVLKIHKSSDWYIALEHSNYVREIVCLEEALFDYRDKHILTHFTRLYTLSIDFHQDVKHNGGQFAYRQVLWELPSSIRRLEITHAHSPDANVISMVREFCPKLEELRLGRCTMFNRFPVCDFWRAFPLEHNSYLSDSGIEDYAGSLARELAPLKRLKILQMGVYLVPSSAVLAHRLYHTRGLPAPAIIDWQQAIPLAQQPLNIHPVNPVQVEPATTSALIDLLHQPDLDFDASQPMCSLCLAEFSEANWSAETAAASILKEVVPSLETIQWMNWFSPRHLGLSS